MNETEVRIIIDDKLRATGWRLPGHDSPNVRAGQRISGDKVKEDTPSYPSGNLEADYVLETDDKFPLAVLEAKRSDTDPLSAKEQARAYANKLNAPFIILSNGCTHYFWEIAGDEPAQIENLPSQEELIRRRGSESERQPFIEQTIDKNYIADTQGENCPEHKIRHLRDYQIAAVQAVRNAAAEGKRKFLLEMATGTGKTLVSAATIKLFLKTGNARRILFIVDRLELEDQAKRNFREYLSNSWQAVILKDNRDDWNHAEIVISTVQTLAANARYKKFSPLDFDLLIIDEAHRAVGGESARRVFDYFSAYKLGLTATPKDYLRGVDGIDADPREYDARCLRDTYLTFGCEPGTPTYRYSLEDGVAAEYLVLPRTLDARTQVTTDMLSEAGFTFVVDEDDEEDVPGTVRGPFKRAAYENIFFAEATNRAICREFLENALRDPISSVIGKTIIYCINQRHAAKITAILNELAADKFPGVYQSDFALQITSSVAGASDYARQFAHNNLNGKTAIPDGYDSAKTRVCVTVGMMTTGYDCPDILNICLMRPIFSPSEFIQMRGRGTRPHIFSYDSGVGDIQKEVKDSFLLFDFFAVCQYVDHEHQYDEKLPLNDKGNGGTKGGGDGPPPPASEKPAKYKGSDHIQTRTFWDELMVDRKMHRAAEKTAAEKLRADSKLEQMVKAGRLDKVKEFCLRQYGDAMIKTLDNLAEQHRRVTDRKVSISEVMQLIFNVINRIKNREELLTHETENFIAGLPEKNKMDTEAVTDMFKACLDNSDILDIIARGEFGLLADQSVLSMETCERVSKEIRTAIVKHIRQTDTSIYT